MKRNLLLEYRIRKLEKLVLEKATGTLPKYFYHGTNKKNAPLIEKNGLTRGRRANHSLSNTNLVYMTDDLKLAKTWAHQSGNGSSGGVVFSIDSSYLDPAKISFDANAVALDYEEALAEDDFQIPDDAFNPHFEDDDQSYSDYTYKGDIPPEALSIVWESDDKSRNYALSLLDSGDWKRIFSDWDSLKDIEITSDMGSLPFKNSVAYELNDVLKSKNGFLKTAADLKKIPVNVLNEPIERYGGATVLSEIIHYSPLVERNLADTISELAKLDNLSDFNIKIFFREFLSKPKQAKFLDVLSELPATFLMRAKPYLAKKYYTQLGI